MIARIVKMGPGIDQWLIDSMEIVQASFKSPANDSIWNVVSTMLNP